jgi:hypothetical protein
VTRARCSFDFSIRRGGPGRGSTGASPFRFDTTAGPSPVRVKLQCVLKPGGVAAYSNRYEQEAIPDRPYRRAVAGDRAAAAQAEVRHPQGRPPAGRRPRGAQRRLLPPPRRPGVAAAAARLPAVADRLRPLPRLAAGRHLGEAPRPAVRGGARGRRRAARAADLAGGQPEREDDPRRRPEGVRRGEKR